MRFVCYFLWFFKIYYVWKRAGNFEVGQATLTRVTSPTVFFGFIIISNTGSEFKNIKLSYCSVVDILYIMFLSARSKCLKGRDKEMKSNGFRKLTSDWLQNLHTFYVRSEFTYCGLLWTCCQDLHTQRNHIRVNNLIHWDLCEPSAVRRWKSMLFKAAVSI